MSSYKGVLTLALTVTLLIQASLTYGEVLFVKPTSMSTPCPTHACHTLSEYAQDFGLYFNGSNLTLQLLPGNHILNVNLIMTRIEQLEILGKSSAVIPTRVLCSFHVGLFFSDILVLNIDGLEFVACNRSTVVWYLTAYYGLRLQSVQTAEIIDCTFRDSYGSALVLVESHVVLRGNNSFLGNCKMCSNGGCDSWVPLCSYINCDKFGGNTCLGGGVFAERSNLSFTGNSAFIANLASLGGGIYSMSDSNVNIIGNTSFIGNRATKDGGGVYSWSNINISGNTTFIANSARDGGGVYSKLNVNIGRKTTFISNSAREHGGAMYSTSNSYVNISGNTIFNGNSARYNGGGVYTGSNSNVNIIGNTTFFSNSATKHGGGVYAESNSIIKLSGTFIGNIARSDGGGVYSMSNSIINLSGKFIRNSARRDGGGVYSMWNNKIKIDGNTTFIDNIASRNGGGVCVKSNSNITISENTTFIGNSASGKFCHGGGIYVGPQCNANISGNTMFIGNAARDGGGVYAGSNSSVNISGKTTFMTCSVSGSGGGVFVGDNSSLNINDDNTFGTNSANLGGGIYLQSNGIVNISGNTTFIGNLAKRDGGGVTAGYNSSIVLSGNTTFSSNLALRGGGIYVERSLRLKGNSSFTNCSANDGGAIYAKETQLTFSGRNVFTANRAAYFGGALYTPKSFLNLPGDNTFIANRAGTKGGGIYAQETKMTFSGTSSLIGNVAQLDGGGVYADGSNLTFSGNLTIRNNSAQLGGGVYSDNNTVYIDGHIVVERNVATYYGGGIYTRRSPLTVAGSNIYVGNSAGEGGGIYATANSTLNLNGVNIFIENRAHVSGGGIWLDSSKLLLNGSNHFVACVASYEGGAIFTYAAKISLPGNNTFEFNSATTGGGLHARWSNVSVDNNCSFKCNTAVFAGGIFTDNSTFKFNGFSTFIGNKARHTGGGIYAARSVLRFSGTTSLIANHAARDGGGMYTRDDTVVDLLGWSIYQNNSVGETGGGISVFQSNINLAGHTTFDCNKAVKGGGFYTFNCTVNFPGKNLFIANSASNHGGGFTIIHSTLHLNGSTTLKINSAASGGGMYVEESTVHSNGSNCFMNNAARSEGGGIDARASIIKFNGRDMFVANSAKSKGAAIHISFTTLIFQGSSSFVNNSAKYGGGIHSENSNLALLHHGSSHPSRVSPSKSNTANSIIPENSFVNNKALRGGAQYFDLYSNCSLDQTAQVHFQGNHAVQFGGAIYVVDVPGPGQFLSQENVPFRSECFFHILRKEQPLHLDISPLDFVNNTAGMRGSVLYGGLLDKCDFASDWNTSALKLFNMSILHVKIKDDVEYTISSDPTQLCFCNTSELNCGEATQSRSIYPGQQIVVSVVAIDQSGSAIPTLIHINVRLGHNLTLSETISYQTEGNCTSRNYSITPMYFYNQLELYPSNKSGSTMHLIVNITFKKCPIGFERSSFSGECICDHRLWQYTNSCEIDKQAIIRNASSTFWLGVSYNNGTPEGFIHHRYCPLDYCTRERRYINLNNPDKQCNYNHSGLLCGMCKEGLSLVLGSSQCKECINNYLALLIPFALAGIILLFLLFLLHFTVAAGTLHGLIFYANIVAANHHIFFPHTSNNPASIFISWLNLDLGIQTCFYNGSDAYAKTWLEFVFPVYIWVIVGFLVYISHRSVTATKLLGSSPVPVLATLFLLSYAKVLRSIIAALSLTILHYPDTNLVVWINDANVPLAKYIPLVLVALVFFLFLFLPYTLLLLLGQWLQPKSHYCYLSWVRNPKLKAILDTYHAPYQPKHRYWIGLLLLLRCALFLVFAFNVSGDNSINLLVISSATFGILGWFTLSGVVYKSWYLNALEVSFILNLGILAVATYHVNQSGGSQAAVAYTSVGIAFLTFLAILIYHVYVRIKLKVQYIQRGVWQQHGNKKFHENHENDNPGNLCHQPRATPTVTHTEVNFHELRSPLDLLPYHQMNWSRNTANLVATCKKQAEIID